MYVRWKSVGAASDALTTSQNLALDEYAKYAMKLFSAPPDERENQRSW